MVTSGATLFCDDNAYTVSQKVPTFKLFVTLSELNRFSKFLHYRKASGGGKGAFQQCKHFENRLRFDKVTKSLKVGTFLDTVYIYAYAPGGTVQGAALGGSKIWNSEIWLLLANWHLHYRQ